MNFKLLASFSLFALWVGQSSACEGIEFISQKTSHTGIALKMPYQASPLFKLLIDQVRSVPERTKTGTTKREELKFEKKTSGSLIAYLRFCQPLTQTPTAAIIADLNELKKSSSQVGARELPWAYAFDRVTRDPLSKKDFLSQIQKRFGTQYANEFNAFARTIDRIQKPLFLTDYLLDNSWHEGADYYHDNWNLDFIVIDLSSGEVLGFEGFNYRANNY